MKQRIFMAIIVVTWVCMAPALGWSHGEDQPGPHGGVVRMPGAFHTEVLPLSENSIAVYLLDIQFKNPTRVDSSVEATAASGTGEQSLSCAPKGDRFECSLPGGATLSSGELFLRAIRNGVQGAQIEYALPLVRRNSGFDEHGRQPAD